MTQEVEVLSPDACARVLRGLADPIRLQIVSTLRAGPLSVSEVGLALGIPQYQASRHLGALLELGLLARERRKRRVFYALAQGVLGEAGDAPTLELGCCRLSVE